MQNYRERYLKKVKRIVIKLGTSTLTHDSGFLNLCRIELLVKQLVKLHNSGFEVILVTSAAISAGMGKIGLTKKAKNVSENMPEVQAIAAIGQGILMGIYEKFFAEHGKTVAQILLTKYDFSQVNKCTNISNTFSALIKLGTIPIVNENDAVSVDEIKFGDNDMLSALVASNVNADLLVILTNTDGLYDSNPINNSSANLMHMVDKITPEMENCASGTSSEFGTGCMLTKLNAAKFALDAGIDMVISNGASPHALIDIMDGKEIGTWFRK